MTCDEIRDPCSNTLNGTLNGTLRRGARARRPWSSCTPPGEREVRWDAYRSVERHRGSCDCALDLREAVGLPLDLRFLEMSRVRRSYICGLYIPRPLFGNTCVTNAFSSSTSLRRYLIQRILSRDVGGPRDLVLGFVLCAVRLPPDRQLAILKLVEFLFSAPYGT